MNIGDIVIIILVIINIVAFASAIWVSCDKWKKGIKEWETPLMGLFFIPLCVFLALVWPYIEYREHREKKKWRQKRLYVKSSGKSPRNITFNDLRSG